MNQLCERRFHVTDGIMYNDDQTIHKPRDPSKSNIIGCLATAIAALSSQKPWTWNKKNSKRLRHACMRVCVNISTSRMITGCLTLRLPWFVLLVPSQLSSGTVIYAVSDHPVIGSPPRIQGVPLQCHYMQTPGIRNYFKL